MADLIVTPSTPPAVTIAAATASVVVQALATGPAGAASASFTHTQSAPANVWTVNHNLGFRPSVTLFDVGGAEIEADILHLSANAFQVSFTSPVAGSARCV